MARTALHWTRTHEGDAGVVEDLDLVLALTTWLIWDQADGKIDLFSDLATAPLPARIPGYATDYERMLLTSAVEGTVDMSQPSAYVRKLAQRWIVHACTDGGVDDADPVATAVLDDPVHLGDQAGETAQVVCPVCSTHQGLRWEWNGITVTVSCPTEHATWIPTSYGCLLTGLDWEHITGQAAPPWLEVECSNTPRLPSAGARQSATREPSLVPELTNAIRAQHRSTHFACSLIVAAYDGDTERTRELLDEVCRHDAAQTGEPQGVFAWSVAMKLDQNVGALAKLVETHSGKQTVETVREHAVSLLAHAPEEVRVAAIELYEALAAGRQKVGALDGPTPPDQIRVELAAGAAHAACWLTLPVVTRPQSLLYEYAHEAVRAAVDGGLAPATRRVQASDAEGLRYLEQHGLGQGFAGLPDERSLSEIEMMARRRVLTGYPADEMFVQLIEQLIDQDLENPFSPLSPANAASAEPRTSVEQARASAREHDRERKGRRKKKG